MQTIAHRELRNNSGAVLHSVHAGRSVGITNHGRLVAMLVPPPTSRLDQLAVTGRVRPVKQRRDVRDMKRVTIADPVVDILHDLKGER